jgi:hypothetical protein
MPGPKSGEKGIPGGSTAAESSQTGHCADVAAGILQSAADLCGVLVVAVVAPLCGDGSARSRQSSPQRLAVGELRRLVDQREQEEQGARRPQQAANLEPPPSAPSKPPYGPPAAAKTPPNAQT